MRLSFVWWNTSLSPAGKDRATDEQRQFVCSMVNFILNEVQVDFLALGETAEKDVEAIIQNCKLTGVDLEFDFSKVGRTKFDICFLYRREKLSLNGLRLITSPKGNRIFKIAQQVDFIIPRTDKPLHIFISHWPSWVKCNENSADRHLLGQSLRNAVEDVGSEHGILANVILLGDYNDEPFHASLAEHLMATRDRAFAKRKPYLFYNPFWRHLGFSKLSLPDNMDEGSGGSYYYNKGEITRWRTFDQMIFSSAFLGHNNWHINEELTGILDFSVLRERVMDYKEIFDHFPVMGVIDEVKKNG
ncbi:MAG: endonuclease/exonuclease/phosphatase family protein [Proteobacteria bacterium]|nr:endonuclease/exonuclease/phosphatase family protein [Pseudomonadota bacterium]